MKLYDSAWAPSPRRVRIYLAEKGIDVPRVQIDLRAAEHLGQPYLDKNPRGSVPALELDDGEVICESSAICRYFEALHPEPALFGTTPVEIARIESWCRRIEQDGYAAVVYVLRNNTAPAFKDRALVGAAPAAPQIAELAARGALMWRAFAAAVDRRLAEAEWLAGERFSFADITALVTIDFALRCKLEMPEDAVDLRRWYATISARPSAAA